MMRRVSAAWVAVLLLALGAGIGWVASGWGTASDEDEITRERVEKLFGEYGLKQYDKIKQYAVTSDGLLQVGDRAPDLELHQLEGGASRISDYYGEKPLFLTFGSYT